MDHVSWEFEILILKVFGRISFLILKKMSFSNSNNETKTNKIITPVFKKFLEQKLDVSAKNTSLRR